MFASRRTLIAVAAFLLMALGLLWGGGVPEALAQVSVTAADPKTGEQGTLNLSVTITGKGFKTGAKAAFFKTKTTDPAGVNVKSTQFVSSTQLTALVDIADGAALSLFDIQVQNTDGRTGKGTELFTVTQKGSVDLTPLDVNVTVLDSSADVGGTLSMIRAEGDSAQPYAARLNASVADDGAVSWFLSWKLVLSSRTSYESQRSVVFEFEPRAYNTDGTVDCYPTALTLDPQDAARPPYLLKTPEFLSSSPAIPDGAQKPWYILVSTGYEWEQDEYGLWVKTDRRFDLRQYLDSPATAPASAVVEFIAVFKTSELDAMKAQAFIAPNGPRVFVKSVGNTWGLVEVRKIASGLEIGPLPDAILSSGLHETYPRPSGYVLDPLPAYQPSMLYGYANLSLAVELPSKLRYKALSAVCDLGGFWMPFRLRIAR